MNMMNKYVDLEHVVEESGLASTMKSGSWPSSPPAARRLDGRSRLRLPRTGRRSRHHTRRTGSHDHRRRQTRSRPPESQPLGATIKVRATLIKVDGRKLEFWCEAWQGEDLLGQASHKRVMVDAEKFVNKTYGFKQ